MNRLSRCALCIVLAIPMVHAETVTAPVRAPQVVEPIKVAPTRNLQLAPPAPATPTSAAAVCVASKSTIMLGVQGMGCRETPPAVWQAQGCPATTGCCTQAGGCLVSSPSNSIRGDGIY